MLSTNETLLLVSTPETLQLPAAATDKDHIVFLQVADSPVPALQADQHSLDSQLAACYQHPSTIGMIFLSRKDLFDHISLKDNIQVVLNNPWKHGIVFLTPYKDPPRHYQSEDGPVHSFIIFGDTLRSVPNPQFHDPEKMLFQAAHAYLNLPQFHQVQVIQVGKPGPAHLPDPATGNYLQQAGMIIPHKGQLSLLQRCLYNVANTPQRPGTIDIVFDDAGYKQFDPAPFSMLGKDLRLFRNSPLNVGPYPARHFSIVESDLAWFFFQDSDDIPVPGRFIMQLSEMRERGLDLIGSHELRIDELLQQVLLYRYPLDVNDAMLNHGHHALFHPTSMISKEAYLKTNGFSTNRRFGYDTQFLMRAAFYLKIGNVDDFLYIRFRRANSLTTHQKTMIGSSLRSFLLWRWVKDYKLIREDKLDLADSSLSRQVHTRPYSRKLL